MQQPPHVLRLDSPRLSLVLIVRESGAPEIAYFGPALPAEAALDSLALLRSRGPFSSALDHDIVHASLMPSLGTGLFSPPAFRGARGGADWTADFAVVDIQQSETRLRLTMRDDVAGLELVSTLEMAAGGVLTMRNVVSTTREAFALDDLAAGVMILPESCGELLVHDGAWCNEFLERRVKLETGSWSAENRRGRTSHDRFPQIIVGTPGFGEDHGLVYGFHLGWSGNHRVAVDVLEDGRRQVRLGEYLHPGEILVEPGKPYDTPALTISCSASGLGDLAASFHAFVRSALLKWPGGAMRPRPVTLNTWEGNYFDHSVAALQEQANKAAALGVERFVVDDGWFGVRDDDTSGLGDWHVDLRKYPHGLSPLIEHVQALGMEFGLWVEPEMINPDSDLYRAHPDWVLTTRERPLVTGRNQLVLDFSRQEVVDYTYFWLDALLRDDAIAYLKWDMNRDLVAASTRAGRPEYHAQVEALYGLLARLRAAHPDVEIESCSSGGGRADYGILARTHRIWVSDCTDALERLRIQRGFLRFFPPEIMGAHISNRPNHQTGRSHTLGWRAAVALIGHLGIEIDPRVLSVEESAELARAIALHKRLRPLLHSGQTIALEEVDGRSGLGVVNNDRSHMVLAIYQSLAPRHKSPAPLFIAGVDAAASYTIAMPQAPPLPKSCWSDGQRELLSGRVAVPGSALGQLGLTLPPLPPETAMVLELRKAG